jgi:predicted NBD/HSP70 family sugar kinase
MKEQNRQVAYQFIRSAEDQSFSRSELSRATGISGPTVIKIVSFFEERGIISPIGASSSGEPGRRASIYKFLPGAAYAVGASYDGQILEMSLVDLNYNTVKYEKRLVNADVPELIGEVLPKLVPEFTEGHGRILGLGLSLPSVVDPLNKRVRCEAFPAMKSRTSKEDLSAEWLTLEKSTGLDVLLENDVNAAAIAEFRARGLSENDDLVYLILGGGVGAGIILDGALRRGKHFACGEVGYMVWDPAFHTDSHESGYLEWELYRYTLDRFGIDLLAEQESPLPFELVEHLATQLSLVVANLSNSMDIRTFVLGGNIYRKVGFSLIKLMNQKLKVLSLHGVTVGEFVCEDACAKGAASQILDAKLDSLLVD